MFSRDGREGYAKRLEAGGEPAHPGKLLQERSGGWTETSDGKSSDAASLVDTHGVRRPHKELRSLAGSGVTGAGRIALWYEGLCQATKRRSTGTKTLGARLEGVSKKWLACKTSFDWRMREP